MILLISIDSPDEDSTFESDLYNEQNEQILHDRNTANADVPPSDQVWIYIHIRAAYDQTILVAD